MSEKQSKMAMVRAQWHRVQTWVTSREDLDGPKDERRALGAGTKMATQRQSKTAKMAPRLHGERTLGVLREDQDGYSKIMQDCQDETKVA